MTEVSALAAEAEVEVAATPSRQEIEAIIENPQDPAPILSTLLRAEDARAIAGRSVIEKVKVALEAVRLIAEMRQGYVLQLGKDSADADLWSTMGATRSSDWLIARMILQRLGYSVTYDQFVQATIISWGA